VFDRDEQEISQVIENGLEAILSGSATLDSVIAQHPEQADVIRPELEGALWLVSRREEVESRPGFVTASRKRVIERIKAEASSQGAKHSMFGFAWPQQQKYQWVLTVIVLMALLTGAGSILTISQTSLPGEDLYSVKRISEQVSYSASASEVQRVELSAEFTDRRLDEAKALIDKGDYSTAEVSLQDYEQGIERTLVLLEQVQVTDTPVEQVEELTVKVQQGLEENTEQLAMIANHVPTTGKVKDSLRSALAVSIDGMNTATRLYDKIHEKISTPPAAPSSTAQQVASPTTQQATATRVPVQPTKAPNTAVPKRQMPNTPVPTRPPRPTVTPRPTATPTDLPTATDTPVPTATDTPVPTATDTPVPTATDLPTATKTPVPTATDLPTSTPPPTATDLPTATDIPTQVPTSTPEPTLVPSGAPPLTAPTDAIPPSATPILSLALTPTPVATGEPTLPPP
jgi:hypothetical protein